MRVVVLLLASLVVSGPHRTAAQGAAHIVMFGDSLTARGNWKKLLGRDDVVNLGVDGDTIRGATKRVPRVAQVRPKIVIVMLGINDLLGGRAPELCVQDMRQLRDRLRAGAPDAQLILASVLPVGPSLTRVAPQIEELNRELKKLCVDGSCAYLDVATAFAAETRGLSPDDLHLSQVGYTRWAEVLRREVGATVARE